MTAATAQSDRSGLPAGGLIVGPDEYVDGRVLCFAKNTATGRYFRLGRREGIILRGLAEGVLPEELSRRYELATGRALGDSSFRDAVRIFGKAGMFAAEVGDAPSDEPLIAPAPTLFTFNLYSWNPDADLDRVIPAWRWLATPWTFAAVGFAVLAVEMLVLFDFEAIVRQAVSSTPAMLLQRMALFLAINGIMFLAHEGAHAIVCKAYGGEVREIGFKIRYLTFTPFTRLDDVLLFTNRWKRAAVFLAGPLASLSILPLAFAGWLFLPVDSLGRQTSADLLIWYNLMFLLQFVPFLQLDGYHIVAQFLRMPQLRQDSYSYIYSSIRQFFGGEVQRPVANDVARWVKPTYIVYGLSSFVITAATLVFLIVRYSYMLAEWLGPWIGYGIVSVLVAVMLARFAAQLKRLHRGTAQ